MRRQSHVVPVKPSSTRKELLRRVEDGNLSNVVPLSPAVVDYYEARYENHLSLWNCENASRPKV